MDAVGRQETKDFITAIAVARVLAFALVPRASIPTGLCQKGPGDACAYSGLHYRRGTLSLGNWNLL